MAFPTSVNDQITDSISQANVTTLGNTPSLAISFLTQATANAMANAGHNAVTCQQQTNITAQAATTLGVKLLASIAASL